MQEHSQGPIFLSYIPRPICWVTGSQQFHNHAMRTPRQEEYEAVRRILNSGAAPMIGFLEDPWDFGKISQREGKKHLAAEANHGQCLESRQSSCSHHSSLEGGWGWDKRQV